MSTLTLPLKWFGGKSYLAPKIVALMPRHLHYVEPFAGGLAVLLERDPNDKRLWVADDGNEGGVSEVVNDINGELTTFWRVLRSPQWFPQFLRMAQATALDRNAFDEANEVGPEVCDDPVRLAWAFFVRCRQSRAGGFKAFTSLTRNRTRRGVNGNVSEWLSCVDGLPAVHARLQPVVIENVSAAKLIRREDGPHTLFYADPPYLHETRTTKDGYAFEMSRADHEELLSVLLACKGKVMLSGYPSDLYDDALKGWTRHTFDIANHTSGAKEKGRETEVLWCNF
jgi:DNA adenine methylase